MSGLPTAEPVLGPAKGRTRAPHRRGTEANASFVLPTCCVTPSTPLMPATPVSHRACKSSCAAPSPSASGARSSRACPCEGRGHHPRPVPCRPQPSLGQALDRRLDRLLAVNPTAEAGRKLARGIRKCRGDLFVFITRRDVPATNNDCERALRPSVIFRKCLPPRRRGSPAGSAPNGAPIPMPTLYPSSPQDGFTAVPLSTPSATPSPAALSSSRRDASTGRPSRPFRDQG